VGALALAFAAGASPACEPTVDEPRPLTELVSPVGFPGEVAAIAPTGNALTEARAQLGKRLFFDKRLSRTGEIACASCHLQQHAFADPNPVSTGVNGRRGRRNAPALVNLAWSESFFWDGRAATLEEQAGKPIEDADEMDLPLAEAVSRLDGDASYAAAFAEAYGGAPSETSLRRALASFVRTLVSSGSAYDEHLRGNAAALSPAARRGLEVFFGEKGGCFHCHPPQTLTNDGFFNNGAYRESSGDVGRKAITGRSGDLGKFKVPGLRNVEVTAPYMHDGSLPTLEAVVEHYARGEGGPGADPSITPLALDAGDKSDLVAFLRALTDRGFLADRRFR
jgi:cytochrome c peroxidase